MATTTEAHELGIQVAPEQRIVLQGIDWATYQRIAEGAGDRRIRLAYDRGELELMSPGARHEDYNVLLSRLIATAAEEWGLPCKGMGSTRWDRAEANRGVEADACFYLTPEKLTASAHRSEKTEDYPTPDLAIEVDLRRVGIDRAAIYSALGIAEVWRFDGKTLRIDQLRPDGAYEEHPRSRFLPIDSGEIRHWVLEADSADHSDWSRRLRAWLRAERVARLGEPAAG